DLDARRPLGISLHVSTQSGKLLLGPASRRGYLALCRRRIQRRCLSSRYPGTPPQRTRRDERLPRSARRKRDDRHLDFLLRRRTRYGPPFSVSRKTTGLHNGRLCDLAHRFVVLILSASSSLASVRFADSLGQAFRGETAVVAHSGVAL